MQEYTIDLAGRIKNFSLVKRNAPLPFYEAIVNPFQAIEDRLAVEIEPSPEMVVTLNHETVLNDENDNIAEMFSDKLSAYIEVLSFSKIVNDAKKRNGIFFDKLSLPS